MYSRSHAFLRFFRHSLFLKAEANILNTGTLQNANPSHNEPSREDIFDKVTSGKAIQQTMATPQSKSSKIVLNRRKALLGSSEDLANDIREFKSHENQKIVSSLMAVKSADVVQYRSHSRPWELVLKPRRHRVNDMIGILLDEHRIEMEQIIWKICDICEVDLYFILVPTVGYVKPRVFAESLFTQWEVGTPVESFVDKASRAQSNTDRKYSIKQTILGKRNFPRSLAKGGNGVLLLLSQQEAIVELVSSYAVGRYFNETMIKLVIKDIFQPLIAAGKDPSYACLQMVYAIARHSDEFKDIWKPYLYPLITLQHKNDALFFQQTLLYGAQRKTGVFFLTFLFMLFGIWALRRLQELKCEHCGTYMKRLVLPQSYYDDMEKVMEIHELPLREARRLEHLRNLFSIYGDSLTAGQRLEMENECAEYKVFMCPSCKMKKSHLIHRQYHNYNNCIKCDKCKHHTVSERKDILRLPTKTEDGIKQFQFKCKNCDWESKTFLPLLHPIELHPKKWYDTLIQRSISPLTNPEIKVF